MDPTVEEAIQRLKEGNASPEDARIAFEAGYQGGPETQKYYAELGLLEPPQDVIPPDPEPTSSKGFNGMPSNLQQHVNSTTPAGYYDEEPQGVPQDVPQDVPQKEQTPQNQPVQPKDRSTIENVFDRGMKAWSPLAPGMIAGGDRSGEAAGYRAGAAIQDKAAADYSKLVQWNKQRAADNTLADKVAAAQASGQWKQNANALGAEGGASVVASQNQAVTPDIMAQKQYQTQQMQNAERNMSEVNARKIAAQNDRTKANMTDYNTQYNESRDAYAHNLATANGQQTPKESTLKATDTKESTLKATDTKDTSTPETTEKPDGKVESTDTTDNTQQAAAGVNQQSQATSDATNEVSEQRQLQDIADEINGIYNTVATLKKDAQQNAPQLRKLKKRYDELKPQYDELASKSKNPPPQASVPDFSMFDEKLSKVPESVLSGVNRRL